MASEGNQDIFQSLQNMQDYPLVLESLELLNFGVHKHLLLTDIPPIFLIVGPNGVGKTTIADALSLVLGGGSDRFEYLKELRLYIGSHEKSAKVTVVLNNISEAKAYLLFSNKEYLRDKVTITLTITSKSFYWTINDAKQKLSRVKLQKILKSSDIKIDLMNEIYYTKKNTIDLFMQGTSTNMFKQIMEPLDLDDLHQEISSAKERIVLLQNKLPRMEYLKSGLQKQLADAEKRKNEYERKQKFKQELNEQKRILDWIRLAKLEKQLVEIQDAFQNVKQKLSEYKKMINSKNNNLKRLEDQKLAIQTEMQAIELKISEVKHKISKNEVEVFQLEQSIKHELALINRYKDELSTKQEELVSLNAEYREFIDAGVIIDNISFKDKMQQLSQDETELASELQGKKDKLERDENEARKLEGAESRLRRILEELKNSLQSTAGKEITSGTYLWKDELNAMKLAKRIENSKIKNMVTNPLFQEIFLKPSAVKLEGAINYAIGNYKGYVLYEEEAVNELRNIMRRERFSLWVAPIPERAPVKNIDQQLRQLPTELKELVIGSLTDFIEIDDSRISKFIYSKVRTLFATDNADAKSLLKIAKITGYDIITPQPTIFKSDGRFRTNLSYSRSLGTRTVNYDKIEQMNQRIEKSKVELLSISEERQKLVQMIFAKKEDYFTRRESWEELAESRNSLLAQSPLKYINESETLTNQVNEHKARITTSEQTVEREKLRLNEISKIEVSQNLEKLYKSETKLDKQVSIVNVDIFQLRSKIEEMTAELEYINQDYESKEAKLFDFEQKCLEQKKLTSGDRPTTIPDEDELHLAIIKNEALISAITATAHDLERWEKLKIEYKEFESNKKAIANQLSKTSKMLDIHYQAWQTKIITTVQKVQDTTNYLLAPLIKIKSRIKNVKQIDEVQLDIRFQRDDDKTYRQFTMGSGGEMALISQALFLSLHTLHYNSPLHIIDEFSQRLDEKYRGHALIMVQRILAILLEEEERLAGKIRMVPQIILIAPVIAGSYIPKEVSTLYLVKVKLLKAGNRITKDLKNSLAKDDSYQYPHKP